MEELTLEQIVDKLYNLSMARNVTVRELQQDIADLAWELYRQTKPAPQARI